MTWRRRYLVIGSVSVWSIVAWSVGGFPLGCRGLAAHCWVFLGMHALATTGGKSTLTAMEWILGQMESRNSSMPKHQPHQQVQGRVDQFFASSSRRRVVNQQQAGTGSSNFLYQAEEESYVQWRTRPSSSASPSPGIADFERKRFVGKAQGEDLSLSMFRKGAKELATRVAESTMASHPHVSEERACKLVSPGERGKSPRAGG